MADNQLELNCPACGKKMHRVLMKDQNLHLDVCLDGCGGIYFDNREFKKFDEQHEDISPLIQAYEGKTFKAVESSEQRICPSCNKKMVKHFASSKHEIQIDDCYFCGGIFLDYNELQRIREQFATEAERGAAALKELEYSIGSKLADTKIKHSTIKEEHILRKNFSNFVKGFIQRF